MDFIPELFKDTFSIPFSVCTPVLLAGVSDLLSSNVPGINDVVQTGSGYI